MYTKNTSLKEVLETNDRAAEIFAKYKLHCVSCSGLYRENIATACRVHKIDLEEFLKELNEKNSA